MLLTAKPYIYVFNCDADELGDTELKKKMSELVAPHEACEMLHEMGIE